MTTAQLNVVDLSNFTGEITDTIAQCWWNFGVRGAVVGCQRVDIATQQATVLTRNGFTVELYAFLYWGLSTLPEVEKCYAVAAAVPGLAGTRIWLDCEAQVPNEAAGQTPDGRVAQLAVVRADVTAHGFTTGIYSGIYYWPTYMGNTTRFSTDPFWLADYFDDHRLVDTVNVGGWTAVAMHQYAGSTNLCGVDVDEDDDITGICSHTIGDPMTPDEKAAFDALTATVTQQGATLTALNTAVVKRDDIMRLACGTNAIGYATMLKAWDVLNAAGMITAPVTAKPVGAGFGHAMDDWLAAALAPTPDAQTYKLGKLPYQHDRRTLHLATYISQPLPAAPATWATPMAKDIRDWPMYGNDRLGDCTCAAAAHLIECWTAATLRWQDVPEQAVIAMYEAITGGQDTGAVELDVLRYWRKNGLAGHKPFAFALIDRMAHEHVKLAASLFAGVYIGIALPKSAQAQTGPHSLWDVDAHGGADAQPGSWGGHAVNVVGYDESTVTVVTWGFLQRMTWAFWDKYCVTPETRVLTDDLRWVPAGSLSVGDGLAGFDEDTTFSRGSLGHARRWRSSVVEEASRIMRPCYELTFDDGTRVRCSAEHKWLTANHRGSRWLTTEALHCGPNAASNVVKPVDVWDEDMSREAGYLAAAFDGEGSLIQSHVDRAAGSLRLTFTQKLNPMLARVMETLEDKGYPATTPNVREDGVVTLTIQQRKEALRFLGSIRPARLLPKLDLDNLGQMSVKTVKLISKRFIGDQEVVAMRTSTGTYFAEGLASHNCDEVWALLPAEWKHTPPKIQGFEFGQFTRDLGRVGRLES